MILNEIILLVQLKHCLLHIYIILELFDRYFWKKLCLSLQDTWYILSNKSIDLFKIKNICLSWIMIKFWFLKYLNLLKNEYYWWLLVRSNKWYLFDSKML
jgi:hypothetical protein